MKETEIDSMKYRKSTHLAGIDVENVRPLNAKVGMTVKYLHNLTNPIL